MRALTQILAIAVKEARELLHRPLLVVTLILGPMVLMLAFGVGAKNVIEPPRAIVVVPPGNAKPRLVQQHQRQFDRFLRVRAYTEDENWARDQLARNTVDAVVILPLAPYDTVASGKQAKIVVLYNEIDPARRQLVPDFVRVMAGDMNREIFLQNAGDQQQSLADATADLDEALRALDLANSAAERGDRAASRQHVNAAQASIARLDDTLAALGPEAGPVRAEVTRVRGRLQEADRRLAQYDNSLSTPDRRPLADQLGLTQTRRNVQGLRDALNQLTSVPPEVAIAPLAVETKDVAQLKSDVISFFAPAILALLLQHTAVSLGSLALVRERLAGTFELYMVAPATNLQLLIGKYLAYVLFTLSIAIALLGLLISPLLNVPLFGSPWRLLLTLVLLALASVGLGLALSLAATSERQAVQLSMLSLLGIVFFSGIALPLDALKMPATLFSFALPATYGVDLLQDIMLRGLPGDSRYLLILAGIAALLFGVCLLLLRWRTRQG